MNDRILHSAFAAAMALSVALPLPAFAAETMAKPAKEPTAAQLATRERMHKCSAEWKMAKAGGKLDKDMKWPKFWSECNKRMKDAAKG